MTVKGEKYGPNITGKIGRKRILELLEKEGMIDAFGVHTILKIDLTTASEYLRKMRLEGTVKKVEREGIRVGMHVITEKGKEFLHGFKGN